MPGMKQSTTPPSPFGAVDNKSAEQLVTEAKQLDAEAPEEPVMAAAETGKVKLTHHLNVEENGELVAKAPGAIIEVDRHKAATLVAQKYAEAVEAGEKPAEKS